MAKFLICCVPTTYAGMFKAIAYSDLILNLTLIAFAAWSLKYEFHLNTLIYIVLTLLYASIVFSALKNFYEKKTPNTKFQHFYSILRLLVLTGSLVASYNTFLRTYLILDNYDGPYKKNCYIFFGGFSFGLVLYFIYNIHWSLQLLFVTFGQRSGEDPEDSEEFLE